MSRRAENQQINWDKLLSVVRKEVRKLNMHTHWACDDVVSQACLEMLRLYRRGEIAGHVMNRAKYCVLDAFRHVTHCRTKYVKNMEVPMPAAELVPSATPSESHAEKLAYAVVELQKIRISPRYGEVLVNMLNGDSRQVACRKVYKNAKKATLRVHLYNIRCQIKQKDSPNGVLNSIDESKLSAEIQAALRRIRMEE